MLIWQYNRHIKAWFWSQISVLDSMMWAKVFSQCTYNFFMYHQPWDKYLHGHAYTRGFGTGWVRFLATSRVRMRVIFLSHGSGREENFRTCNHLSEMLQCKKTFIEWDPPALTKPPSWILWEGWGKGMRVRDERRRHWSILQFSPYMFVIFIARQHTDARYWYSKSVRPSVCPSVTFRYQMKTA